MMLNVPEQCGTWKYLWEMSASNDKLHSCMKAQVRNSSWFFFFFFLPSVNEFTDFLSCSLGLSKTSLFKQMKTRNITGP